mgnify:FL=1
MNIYDCDSNYIGLKKEQYRSSTGKLSVASLYQKLIDKIKYQSLSKILTKAKEFYPILVKNHKRSSISQLLLNFKTKIFKTNIRFKFFIPMKDHRFLSI